MREEAARLRAGVSPRGAGDGQASPRPLGDGSGARGGAFRASPGGLERRREGGDRPRRQRLLRMPGAAALRGGSRFPPQGFASGTSVGLVPALLPTGSNLPGRGGHAFSVGVFCSFDSGQVESSDSFLVLMVVPSSIVWF